MQTGSLSDFEKVLALSGLGNQTIQDATVKESELGILVFFRFLYFPDSCIFQAKQCFGSLQKTLVELEEEIAKKANSLYIDEVSIKIRHFSWPKTKIMSVVKILIIAVLGGKKSI